MSYSKTLWRHKGDSFTLFISVIYHRTLETNRKNINILISLFKYKIRTTAAVKKRTMYATHIV